MTDSCWRASGAFLSPELEQQSSSLEASQLDWTTFDMLLAYFWIPQRLPKSGSGAQLLTSLGRHFLHCPIRNHQQASCSGQRTRLAIDFCLSTLNTSSRHHVDSFLGTASEPAPAAHLRDESLDWRISDIFRMSIFADCGLTLVGCRGFCGGRGFALGWSLSSNIIKNETIKNKNKVIKNSIIKNVNIVKNNIMNNIQSLEISFVDRQWVCFSLPPLLPWIAVAAFDLLISTNERISPQWYGFVLGIHLSVELHLTFCFPSSRCFHGLQA